jgi:ADP-heptose:LPS heptosyltransferase
MAAPLLAALPYAIDLDGRLSLSEAAACLERATLFIGNDSGLMHLAAAAGAPTIGLFGPTDAAIYGPTGRRAVAVVADSMQAISVDQAVAAARTLLDQTLLDQPPTAAASSASAAATSRRVVSS